MSELNNDYNYRYSLTSRFGGWHHRYIIETAHGALELQITEYPDGLGTSTLEESGGVESHFRSPPDYMAERPPSHHKCDALGGNPCWHDGSSTWAVEHFIPLWKVRSDEREMFRWLLPHVGRLKEADDD